MLAKSILHKSVMMMRQPQLLHKLFASVPHVVMNPPRKDSGWVGRWLVNAGVFSLPYFSDIFGAILFLHLLQQHFVGNQENWSKHIFVKVFFVLACRYVPVPVNSFPIFLPSVIMKFQRKDGEWDANWSMQGYFLCYIFLTFSGQYIFSIFFNNILVANQENWSKHIFVIT